MNRVRSDSVELLVPADSERPRTRYQVLMRTIKSAIETARYAVDKENMKTITPNKIFELSEFRPFWLNGSVELTCPDEIRITHIIICVETGMSDA